MVSKCFVGNEDVDWLYIFVMVVIKLNIGYETVFLVIGFIWLKNFWRSRYLLVI